MRDQSIATSFCGCHLQSETCASPPWVAVNTITSIFQCLKVSIRHKTARVFVRGLKFDLNTLPYLLDAWCEVDVTKHTTWSFRNILSTVTCKFLSWSTFKLSIINYNFVVVNLNEVSPWPCVVLFCPVIDTSVKGTLLKLSNFSWKDSVI